MLNLCPQFRALVMKCSLKRRVSGNVQPPPGQDARDRSADHDRHEMDEPGQAAGRHTYASASHSVKKNICSIVQGDRSG